MLKHIVFYLGFSCLCSFLNAQELPPIEYYQSIEYGAENQNWSISQSSEGYIYVANNKGLLEFNGASWQLYPTPNRSIIRSVNVIENKIYTGSYMDFGYWQRDDFGYLSYTSLSKKLKIPLKEDEQFWNIIDVDHYILFQSLNRIYIYDLNDNTFKIIASKNRITKIFKVSGSIYYQSLNEGIYKIQNGVSKIICDNSIVKTNLLVNIFDKNGMLLIQTEENGFFILESNQLSPWNIPTNKDFIANLSVYSSLQLRNGNFVLGTISNGMVYLTKNGEVIYNIDQKNGLGNNTVLSVFEDIENNIWLGLDNGINVVNINSPFRIYNDEEGKLGTVYASTVYEGKLYLGTNQGLFYKPLEGKNELTFVKGTKGQVWCLEVYDDTLFCGHNIGTFVINNDKAELIIDTPGSWNIKPFDADPNILLQGNYEGINVLFKENNKWVLRNKLEGFDISSKYFEVLNKNKLFISHEYKGVFELELDDKLTSVKTIRKVEPLEKGFNSSLIKYNDKILYTYEKGVYIYDDLGNQFIKDSLLSSIFKNDRYTSGKLIVDAYHDRLWTFSERNLNYISPGKLSQTPSITFISFPQILRNEMFGYETITHLNNNVYLLGTSSGYINFDLDKLSTRPYKISINTITDYAKDEKPKMVKKSLFVEFDSQDNNLQFTYNVPEYNKYLLAEYQYQLKGYYDEWSNWSDQPSVLFKNLPYGNYTFYVRGRVGNIVTDNIASLKFKIRKPWYMTNIMIGLYVICLLLFSIIIHHLYKRYYKKQKEKLIEENIRNIEIRQLENEQRLMLVENEKLQQDIESKNRELAISTMSLIKKNEFLNTIKDELKKADDLATIRPVIRFIDRNLNNTDDWKFFQEAFNNADKDFLKKIKAKHSSLTPNDLKLCAYLRLNLSSKEIAPLLNISPKSVEVKRYRLRKKMDLPHDYSLTNYILEI